VTLLECHDHFPHYGQYHNRGKWYRNHVVEALWRALGGSKEQSGDADGRGGVSARRVLAWIDLYQGRSRRSFNRSLKRSGRYLAMARRIFAEEGVPQDLTCLAHVESGFRHNARSPARALGLWQFIPSTGYKFGLKRTIWIDERLDPVNSTKAAIAYLSELHEMFGDWSTVLAAYNCVRERC